jgi:hypothetical protein
VILLIPNDSNASKINLITEINCISFVSFAILLNKTTFYIIETKTKSDSKYSEGIFEGDNS